MGPPRLSAKLDERSRAAKAQKIATLSGIARPPPGAAMLYCGSGSGDFAAYFSRLGFGESGTFAVDAVDTEAVGSEYQFSGVLGSELPFPDGRFDFIISNHVIKHFADREQRTHLAEIGRCLRDNGKLYIAVPNRWGLYRCPSSTPFPRLAAEAPRPSLSAIDPKSRQLRMVPVVAPRHPSPPSTRGLSG